MLNAYAGVPRNLGFHQYKFSLYYSNMLKAAAGVSELALAFISRSFQYYETVKIL